jgi:hypothetical protein
MSDKKTVLFRLCAGCDTPLGLQLRPWLGSPFESTHTLCSACDDRIREAAPGSASPGLPDEPALRLGA